MLLIIIVSLIGIGIALGYMIARLTQKDTVQYIRCKCNNCDDQFWMYTQY